MIPRYWPRCRRSRRRTSSSSSSAMSPRRSTTTAASSPESRSSPAPIRATSTGSATPSWSSAPSSTAPAPRADRTSAASTCASWRRAVQTSLADIDLDFEPHGTRGYRDLFDDASRIRLAAGRQPARRLARGPRAHRPRQRARDAPYAQPPAVLPPEPDDDIAWSPSRSGLHHSVAGRSSACDRRLEGMGPARRRLAWGLVRTRPYASRRRQTPFARRFWPCVTAQGATRRANRGPPGLAAGPHAPSPMQEAPAPPHASATPATDFSPPGSARGGRG